MSKRKAVFTFNPLRFLWALLVSAVSVYVFGWAVLIPLILISIELEFAK